MKTKQNSNRFGHQWQLEKDSGAGIRRSQTDALRVPISHCIRAYLYHDPKLPQFMDHTIHFLDPTAVGGTRRVTGTSQPIQTLSACHRNAIEYLSRLPHPFACRVLTTTIASSAQVLECIMCAPYGISVTTLWLRRKPICLWL